MTWKQYVIPEYCIPMLFEVGKWDYEINFPSPFIPTDYELEAKFRGVVDESLVERHFVVYRDFGIMK